MKKTWKKQVEELAEMVADTTCLTIERMGNHIVIPEKDMPYKYQYILESVISNLQKRV